MPQVVTPLPGQSTHVNTPNFLQTVEAVSSELAPFILKQFPLLGNVAAAVSFAKNLYHDVDAAVSSRGHAPSAGQLKAAIQSAAKSVSGPAVAPAAAKAAIKKHVLASYPPTGIGRAGVENAGIKQVVVAPRSFKLSGTDKVLGMRYYGARSKGAVQAISALPTDPTFALPFKNSTTISTNVTGTAVDDISFFVFSSDFFSNSLAVWATGPTVAFKYFGLYPNAGALDSTTYVWGWSATRASLTVSRPADLVLAVFPPVAVTPPIDIGDLTQRTSSSIHLQVSTTMEANANVRMYAPDCYPRTLSRRSIVRTLTAYRQGIYGSTAVGLTIPDWFEDSCLMDATDFLDNTLDSMLARGQTATTIAAATSGFFVGMGPPVDTAWRRVAVDDRTQGLGDAVGWSYLLGSTGIDFTTMFYGSCSNIGQVKQTGQSTSATVGIIVDVVADFGLAVDPANSAQAMQCLTLPSAVSAVRRCSAGCAGYSPTSFEEAAEGAIADSAAMCKALTGIGRELVPSGAARVLGSKIPPCGLASCEYDLTIPIRENNL